MTAPWYPLSVPTIGDQEIDAVVSVLRSGLTTMGREVSRFEKEFARGVGAKHAVMVNSGSSADLILSFAVAQRVSPLAEVLVPAVTWPTQVWGWKMAGLRVRLVDVNPATLNTSAHLLSEQIGDATAVLSLVHLMGNPCDLEPIRALADEHDLIITEDCCEALGATYGGRPIGRAGLGATWSFFFSHQMTTMEGGMVTTDDADLADAMRGLRSHGWTRHVSDDLYTFADWGFNVRPTEVQAAIGRVQLGRVHRFNHARRVNYRRFADAIAGTGLSLPSVPADSYPSPFGLPIMVDKSAACSRNDLVHHLGHHGVETRPILGGNLARQPVARRGLFDHGDLPGADDVQQRGLFIGLHPDDNDDVERLAGIIRQRVPVAA